MQGRRLVRYYLRLYLPLLSGTLNNNRLKYWIFKKVEHDNEYLVRSFLANRKDYCIDTHQNHENLVREIVSRFPIP